MRQKITATIVLTKVAIIAGATTAVGLVLPYWLLYAIIFTGISWRDDTFITKKVHIAFEAVLSLSLSCARLFIALRPAGVAAQPSPRIFAITFVVICFIASCCGGT